MTKILCDQCGQNADTPNHASFKMSVPGSIVTHSKRWDFCSSECFWKWVEEKKPKPAFRHEWIMCANCEGVGCLVCEGKGGFGVSVG